MTFLKVFNYTELFQLNTDSITNYFRKIKKKM